MVAGEVVEQAADGRQMAGAGGVGNGGFAVSGAGLGGKPGAQVGLADGGEVREGRLMTVMGRKKADEAGEVGSVGADGQRRGTALAEEPVQIGAGGVRCRARRGEAGHARSSVAVTAWPRKTRAWVVAPSRPAGSREAIASRAGPVGRRMRTSAS